MRLRIAAPLLIVCPLLFAAKDVPVPAQCTPEVNAHLVQLIKSGGKAPVDNVMVCGLTTRNSRFQAGHGRAGSHHVFSVLTHTPAGDKLVEVVSNDSLDGVVTARRGDQIFAFGQAFFDNTGQFAAGIHDVHCSTHSGADNGWIVVNGTKHPASCSSR
jgi:hypothetical protein